MKHFWPLLFSLTTCSMSRQIFFHSQNFFALISSNIMRYTPKHSTFKNKHTTSFSDCFSMAASVDIDSAEELLQQAYPADRIPAELDRKLIPSQSDPLAFSKLKVVLDSNRPARAGLLANKRYIGENLFWHKTLAPYLQATLQQKRPSRWWNRKCEWYLESQRKGKKCLKSMLSQGGGQQRTREWIAPSGPGSSFHPHRKASNGSLLSIMKSPGGISKDGKFFLCCLACYYFFFLFVLFCSINHFVCFHWNTFSFFLHRSTEVDNRKPAALSSQSWRSVVATKGWKKNRKTSQDQKASCRRRMRARWWRNMSALLALLVFWLGSLEDPGLLDDVWADRQSLAASTTTESPKSPKIRWS